MTKLLQKFLRVYVAGLSMIFAQIYMTSAWADEPVTVPASEEPTVQAPTINVEALHKAAVRGDAASQVRYGELFVQGEVVKADETEAAKWFLKAADRGNVDAQFDLGLLYIRGAGVPKDNVQAYKWLTLAADGGRKDATEPRDGIAGDMQPPELDKARALARSWKPSKKAADKAVPARTP